MKTSASKWQEKKSYVHFLWGLNPLGWSSRKIPLKSATPAHTQSDSMLANIRTKATVYHTYAMQRAKKRRLFIKTASMASSILFGRILRAPRYRLPHCAFDENT